MKNAEYIFSDWGKIEKSLRNKFIYLFLDYDGTVAPIAVTPGGAVIPKGTKDLLRQLSEAPNRKIAIVSGRALKDVSGHVGLKDIIYVGNHGFEIKGQKIKFKSPVGPGYRKTLRSIRIRLKKNLSSIKGVLMENKGYSISVHYRLADKKRVPAIRTEFYKTILPYELRGRVIVRPGKMVLEIGPPTSWDKGKAVLWLLDNRSPAPRNKKMKVVPIYIGDDTTDEDAFESLKDEGVTIFVGKPVNTKARFYLKNPKEVARFLEAILKI